MSIDRDLIRYIEENLLEAGETIAAEDPLIDRGLLDSIGLMQIMQFVEDHEGVRIPDTEVTPDNFNSVASIGAMVERLRTT